MTHSASSKHKIIHIKVAEIKTKHNPLASSWHDSAGILKKKKKHIVAHAKQVRNEWKR